VQTVGEALADPAAQDGLWPMEGASYGAVPTVASPLRFSRTPPALRDSAPALGEHTAQIQDLGWDAFVGG
jgi:crotonobetainyl-CoA:carnitine CoA-transferase CaiB-like acyl-CoA transferase